MIQWDDVLGRYTTWALGVLPITERADSVAPGATRRCLLHETLFGVHPAADFLSRKRG